VCNPAYLPVDISLLVAEHSPQYEFKQNPLEWTDDEIAYIRLALRRLTAIRILNETDAEDLVQDTLLTMITRYPGDRLQKSPLIWSMGILRNKVGNYWRKSQRNALLGRHAPHALQRIQTLALEHSPETKVLQRELQQIVDETMAQIPPHQRRPLELLISGLDTREIVRHLHPERYQNVINWLYRGRKKLAKELAKHGFGPDAKTGMHAMKRCRGKK